MEVSGQNCMDKITVGSLDQDNTDTNNNVVLEGLTFIFAGYAIPCSGTVVAWEFCHRTSSEKSATFYPGVWNNDSDLSTEYILIQSTSVTFDTRGGDMNVCQKFSVLEKDQFIAPVGSFVGLYSNKFAQLLRTNASDSITTFQFDGNQTSSINKVVHFNIALKVLLGKYKQEL